MWLFCSTKPWKLRDWLVGMLIPFLLQPIDFFSKISWLVLVNVELKKKKKKAAI